MSVGPAVARVKSTLRPIRKRFRRLPSERQPALWRRATSFARLAPNFMIIGAQKGGTSSLYAYLLEHPGVLGYKGKEIFYFDLRYARGEAWYAAHFPVAARAEQVRRRLGIEPRIGEATVNYIFDPRAPRRVHEFDPRMKLIVLLRDPVSRAYSGYQLERDLRREPLSFEEAIEREPQRLEGELERMLAEPTYDSRPYRHWSYLARGRYLEQLERWFELFPAEQILVLKSEDLFRQQSEVLASVLDFLELPELGSEPGLFPEVNRRDYVPLSPELRDRLACYFSGHNERLYEFLGRDFGWLRPASAPGAE